MYPPGLLATWTDPEKGYTFFSTVTCDSGDSGDAAGADDAAAVKAEAGADGGDRAAGVVGEEGAAAGATAADAAADGGRGAGDRVDGAGAAPTVTEGAGGGGEGDGRRRAQACEGGVKGGGEAVDLVFRVSVKACGAPGGAAEAEAALAGSLVVGESGKDPDAAWREAFALQRVALMLPRAPAGGDGAAAAGALEGEGRSDADAARAQQLVRQPALLDLLQQATLPPLHWGMHLFGLAAVPVLVAIEGQAAVEQCSEYVYAEVRCQPALRVLLFHAPPPQPASLSGLHTWRTHSLHVAVRVVCMSVGEPHSVTVSLIV